MKVKLEKEKDDYSQEHFCKGCSKDLPIEEPILRNDGELLGTLHDWIDIINVDYSLIENTQYNCSKCDKDLTVSDNY